MVLPLRLDVHTKVSRNIFIYWTLFKFWRLKITFTPRIMRDANSVRNSKKVFIYNKNNGTTTLNKYVEHEHVDEYNKWVLYLEQKKQGLEAIENWQQHRKKKVAPPSQITSFFGITIPYHKSAPTQHVFLEDLCFYITKGYCLLSSIENPWLKWLMVHKNPKVVFPSRHHLIKEILPCMVSKTMDLNHVFLALTHCITYTTSFNLWMSHASYITFAMVINFIDFTL